MMQAGYFPNTLVSMFANNIKRAVTYSEEIPHHRIAGCVVSLGYPRWERHDIEGFGKAGTGLWQDSRW